MLSIHGFPLNGAVGAVSQVITPPGASGPKAQMVSPHGGIRVNVLVTPDVRSACNGSGRSLAGEWAFLACWIWQRSARGAGEREGGPFSGKSFLKFSAFRLWCASHWLLLIGLIVKLRRRMF